MTVDRNLFSVYFYGMKLYSYLLFFLISLTLSKTSSLQAQLTANFQADKISGCRPLVVSFEDLSVDAVSWSWDYEVGSSSVTSPSAFFSLPGTYDVRLIVTDANGNQDTLIKKDYISVYEFPSADFSINDTEICSNTLVQFTDLSQANSGQLTSWVWDFGNGKTSTDQHPTITYPESGSFPVSLLVKNEFGCTDNVIRQNLIKVQAPDVSFDGSNLLACGAPHTADFVSTGNMTGDHLWLFGDGNTSTEVNPSHTYTTDGSFSVSHIITDQQGCTDTLRKESLVGIGVNTLSAYVVDSSVCVNDTAFFISNAPQNSQITWDFGNGQTDTTTNPYIRYSSPGTYTVTAHVSDVSGCNYFFTDEIEVSDYPNVSFTVADTTLGCTVPFQVDFLNTTLGADTYFWSFGDGEYSTLENPTHIYTELDTFSVSLVAYGPTGCRSWVEPKDYIKIQKVEAGFFAEPIQGCVPLEVNFQDTTHSPFPITNWEWDFGNGNQANGYTSTSTYNNTGEYDVRLIVTNNRGCADTLVASEYIKAGTFPNMDFTASVDSTCALTEIQFTNFTSGAQDFLWFFGDGDTAMSKNPKHGFLGLGDMDITLIASDRGCADTLTKTTFIHVKAPLPVIGKNAARLCYLPDSVTLYNLSEKAEYSYWTFPDGSTSTDLVTRYTFVEDGQKKFFLTAGNDSTGCIVTAEDSVVANDIKSRFAVDQLSGCVPFTINLMDSSVNAIEWKWYFGNGDSSSLQNPSYTYYNPGNYTVSLVVRNSFFCRDTIINTQIRALGPAPDFQISSGTAGCVPFILQIEDLSVGTSPIVSWDWDFGDGQHASSQNPSHTYLSPDLFDISLTVTDSDGCMDSVLKQDVAFITQPVPNFAVNPPTNCLDKNSTFVSLSSGSGLFYTWDFGDGNTSHLANTFHSYADTGFYDIRLHIVDENGCDSSITRANFVEIRELEAVFWADTIAAPCPPLTVNFKADNSFPHIGVKWKWDFGDGATSTDVFPTHIYNSPGSFAVSLILESPEGCTDTMTIDNMVNIQGPISSFSYTPQEGCLGTEIYFTVDTVKPNITYDWILGDGNQSNLDSVFHRYDSPGMYFPILVAKDTLGCEVFSANSDPINIHAPPIASFGADQQILCNGGTVQFQDLSTISGSIIRNWKWFFGDGDSASVQHPTHTYSALGTYEVRLIVESNEGCLDTLIQPNFIEVATSPSIGITLDKEEGCGTLDFTYAGTSPNQGMISDWNWDFGDGNQATGQNGTYTYSNVGDYTISLDIVDNNGCTASARDTVQVHPFPAFTFTEQDIEGCAPHATTFQANSTEIISSWLWDFGDGTQDTVQNPIHTYQLNGVYAVSLSATNEFGCSSFLKKENLVILSLPVADFELSEDVVCSSGTIFFTDKSFGNHTLTNWSWDFGDGSRSNLSDPLHAYPQGGSYDISLRVTDNYGCADTLLIPHAVTVLPDSLPATVQLTHISVASDTEIQLNYEAFDNSNKDFNEYLIYRSNGSGVFTIIDSVQDQSQTYYTDRNVNTLQEVYCYQVRIKNQCGLISPSDESNPHCSIELSSQGSEEQVSLSWNTYTGWPFMDGYKIYRVSGYKMGDAELIASLGQSDSTYIDSSILCEGSYAYRIAGVGPGGYISYSDTSSATASSAALLNVSDVINASVENDEFIRVEFTVADIKNASSLIIERDAGGGFQEVGKQSLSGQSGKFQDRKADVHNRSYTYRAFTADTCGRKTPLGQMAKSIYAQASQAGNSIKLSWNAFEGWENGVKSYKVERFDDASNSYIEIAELTGGMTNYEDPSPLGGNTLNCYRILAEELNGNEMVSVSNSNCVGLDPIMFTATGFTPNGDGINDVFKVTVSFLDTYELSIYNRWGKLVFKSNNPQEVWDGRTRDGRLAQEGVYLYSVTGKGKQGQFIQNNGSLSLIR